MSRWLEADWRECSALCGNGTRSRRQICIKMTIDTSPNGTQQSSVERVGDRSHCAASRPVVVTEPCTSRLCAEWTTDPRRRFWSSDQRCTAHISVCVFQCSVQCGTKAGQQWRKVACRTVESGAPSHECDVFDQPSQRRACTAANRECRFAWHLDVGNCSQECGGGTVLLTAVCRASADGGHVQLPDFVCGAAGKPRSRRSACNTDPCPTRETTEEWEDCQRSCGSGVQLRKRCVRYIDAETRVAISEPQCTVLEERVCNAFDCPHTLTWASWGNCSTACGRGEQSRSPTCELVVANGTRYQYTPTGATGFPDECKRALAEAESARRACFGSDCVYKWRSGEWSPCSTSCNPGWRHCNVTCYRVDTSSGLAVDTLVDDTKCLLPKPTTTMSCNEDNHCPRYEPSLTWGECNASCNGLGMEFMLWRCMRGRRQVAMSACRDQPAHGQRVRTCHGHQCPMAPHFKLGGKEVTVFPMVLVARGEVVTLNCPVFGYPPPTVTWSWLDADQHQFFENLRSLNALDFLERGQRLRIPADSAERLRGKFTCTGSNAVLQKAKASGELAIASPPEFDTSTPDRVVTGNVNLRGRSSFRIPCTVRGYPRPTVAFYKDGVLIPDDHSHASDGMMVRHGRHSNCRSCHVHDGVLHLRNVSTQDSGSYTCVANNSFGRVESQPAIITVASFFSWKAIFGSCSSTCGRGTRRFLYECHADGSGRVDAIYCAQVNRTRLTPVPCYLEECQVQLRLKLRWESWSACSSTCGPGVRQRTRVCRKRHASSGSDANSTAAPSPDYPLHRCLAGGTAAEAADVQRTQTQTCHTPCNSVWHYETVGACNVTCGAGMQQLRATCMRYTKNRKWKTTNSEEKCRLKRGAKNTTIPCHGLPANSTECLPARRLWWPGPWQSCANFYRNREVYCYKGLRRVAEFECAASGPKPHMRESCVRWHISGWSQCMDCYQRRNVSCYFTDPRREVPLSYCREVATEPERYQSCGDCPQHRFSHTRTPNPRPNLDRMLSNVDKCTKPGLHYCSRVMSVRLCRKAYYQDKCNCECKRVLHAAREAARALAS